MADYIDLAPNIYRQRLVVEAVPRQPVDEVAVPTYLVDLSDTLGMQLLSDPVTHCSPRHGLAGWVHWSDSDHLAEAKAVSELSSQMGWSWDKPTGPSSLLLALPEVPGRPASLWKHEDWKRDGVSLVRQATLPTFALIRRLAIWDALTSQNTTVGGFKNELSLRSAPITSVDDQQQQRCPAIHTIDQQFYVADWQQAQSTNHEGTTRKLSSDLRKELGNAAVPWDNPHRMLAVTLRRLVKLNALTCVHQLRDPCQRQLTGSTVVKGTERRVPLHLFLGEQLAAELEQQSLRLLDEQITIPTDLIGLFEYGDEPARFARAVAFEQITPHTDRNTGNLSWSAQVPVNGSTKSVSCGDGAFEACRNFAQPDSPSLGHAIEEVWNAVRAAEDQLADVTYPEQLRTKARGRLMPETDTTEPAVRDGLDRTSRMLLCKHAEKIG